MPDFKMGNPAKTVISQSGTANPTLSDSVVMTNKYYLHLKCGTNHIESDGDAYIRTTDTTAPYFTKTGDTTNILATDTTNIKAVSYTHLTLPTTPNV